MLDRELAVLQSRKAAWARLPVGTKIEHLRDLCRATSTAALRWVTLAALAKQIQHSPLVGEEWLTGPWALLRAGNRYARTLRSIQRNGDVPISPRRFHARPGAGISVDVFPSSFTDRVLLPGVRARTLMLPSVNAQTLQQSCASFYKETDAPGRVALVLGAGNVNSIAPLDALYRLFACGDVCMLKLSPVNAYLRPVLETIFAGFITGGYLSVTAGGADEGRYLCAHRAVEAIHVTGSERTMRAIAAGLPHPKPITSELGNVSPTIVVPGNWNRRQIDFQAEHIASQKLHNAGFNCVAAQVLVLPKQWDLRAELLAAIGNLFSTIPVRYAYYPGSTAHPNELVRIDASADDPLFEAEVFGNRLGYVELDGDPIEYLQNAVRFANDRLRGSLGANVIVDSGTRSAMREPIDEALEHLRYGCVAVNTWTGVAFAIPEIPWGAYRGPDATDTSSGSGVVHNAYFFDSPQRTVVEAPFHPLVKPPFFVTNRRQAKLGRWLCKFESLSW